MGMRLYREYQLKFYLNARHYIIINGSQGDTHPHTWEFSLNIRIGRDSFTQFNTFERGINAFLARYQNQLLNEVAPFDGILPTVENMTDYFSQEFYRIIHDVGGDLRRIEASETPTRSYILNLEAGAEADREEPDMLSDLVDSVLEDILQ